LEWGSPVDSKGDREFESPVPDGLDRRVLVGMVRIGLQDQLARIFARLFEAEAAHIHHILSAVVAGRQANTLRLAACAGRQLAAVGQPQGQLERDGKG